MIYRWLLIVVVLCIPCAADEVDPWEPFNRKVFKFNDAVDRAVLVPLAKGYNLLPRVVRTGIGNVFRNLGTPTVFVNQFLQGKPREAGADLGRFVVNTTIGIGGIFDVAARMNLPAHEEDFGQTLAVWGVGQGPYLVVPFWGASSIRAGSGDLVGIWTNPLHYVDDNAVRYGTFAVWGIDKRAGVLAAESFVTGDRYLFLRDAYLQRREYLIHDGEVEEDPFLDDF